MQRAWLVVWGVGLTGIACLSSERAVGVGVVVAPGGSGAGGQDVIGGAGGAGGAP